MSVSEALKKSAKAFSEKYACKFDFATFEERVDEFTFLRPNGGWIDVYKMTFERMYKNALEKLATGGVDSLDGEAMLDDFEYTLIRPYVNESETEIKHKSYVGMDRIARIEYLEDLTQRAPTTLVELYVDKYKNGELSFKKMKAEFSRASDDKAHRTELAGYTLAIESVNQSRSFAWRAFHPFKNSAEKREAAMMKKALEDASTGGESYDEITAAANAKFDRYQTVNAHLRESMRRAEEEMNRLQKMNDATRESLRIEGFDNESDIERSPRVDQHNAQIRDKQI